MYVLFKEKTSKSLLYATSIIKIEIINAPFPDIQLAQPSFDYSFFYITNIYTCCLVFLQTQRQHPIGRPRPPDPY